MALTGEAPFEDGDAMSSFRRASAGDLAAALAALAKCGADGELKALCRRCLAPDPADRPADGAAVAGALRRYEDEVRQRLERERTDRAAAAVRTAEHAKRRRLWIGSGAAVAALLIAGLLGSLWLAEERTGRAERVAKVRTSVPDLVKWGMVLRADYQFDDAEAMLDNGRDQLIETEDDVLRATVADAYRQLTFVRALDAARLALADPAADPAAVTGTKGVLAAAFRVYGVDPVAGDPAGVGALTRADPVADSLVAALDVWAAAEPNAALRSRLLSVAAAADERPGAAAIREAVAAGDAPGLARAAGDANPADPDGLRASTLTLLAAALAPHDAAAARGLLTAASDARPSDFWLHLAAADALADFPEDAKAHLKAAAAVRPGSPAVAVRLAALDDPKAAASAAG